MLSRKDYRNSYATILWDNAFPVANRRMFETYDTVLWPQLAQVLGCKFYRDIGKHLTSDHLVFIGSMLSVTSDQTPITWDQFAKRSLPMRSFTFFEWFYKILVLVREELLTLYRDDLIHGFISSQLAEQQLLQCVDGTFLIRFSETYCGAISVAYVKDRRFQKLFPWDLDRLRKISLPHTIKCTDFLLYLHPNIPKNEVFSKLYVHSESTRSITGKDYKPDTNIAQILQFGDGKS